jgi:RNA polymerase sigma-70 factor (ECF subfamily)
MTASQIAKLQTVLTNAHHEYEEALTSRAYFKIRDKSVCKDLVQDTFLKTWRYLVKGGKVHTMKAFLYHILNCLIVDEYRKHKTVALDVLTEKGFEPSFDNTENHLNFLDGEAVLPLIKKLPEIYRGVMRMRYVQDLTLEEISVITGQPKNTVAVQIHRGLIKLKLLYNRT